MGYVVKAKVGDMEENTKGERSRRMRKEVVGCVQDVVGKKRLLVLFEYRQKKDTSYCSLVFLCLKEEADMDESLYNYPKKE